MKTKFTELLRIKSEAVRDMERQILGVAIQIERARSDMDGVLREIAGIEIPSHGTYMDFIKIQAIKSAYIDELELKKLEIAELKEMRERLEERLRFLNLEYEKAKYLDKLEMQKIIAHQKRQEELQMDEVSLMLFNSRVERDS
ncbi:MAG: flagellar export protein FliJ [Wolinella sp.]